MSNNLLVSAIALPNALFSTRSVSVPKHLIEVPLFFWNISTIFIWKKIFTMGLSIQRFTNKLVSRLYLDTNVWKWCYKSSVGQFLRKREPKRMITNFYHLWYSNIWYMLRAAFFARIVVVSWKWKQNDLTLTSAMINLNTYGVLLYYPTCFNLVSTSPKHLALTESEILH